MIYLLHYTLLISTLLYHVILYITKKSNNIVIPILFQIFTYVKLIKKIK